MFVYKKLKASDVGITAFEAHKEFNINKDNTASLGISLLDSSFSSASKDTYSSTADIRNHKNYFQLDHLFYNDALFNYGNLLGGLDYNQQEKRLYNKATIISISQKNFGSGIQKGSFDFNNNFIDDSKGNLYSKTTILSDYPEDKERVFYVGPVKGHKFFDLNRNPDTGESIVNAPSRVNTTKLDDSLYTNVIEYVSCSFSESDILNCPIITLNDGYIKAPHNKSYNFGDEDFTITFWYQTGLEGGEFGKFILGKSTTKTIVETPAISPNGDLLSTGGSASLSQPVEVDAGQSFPFEVTLNTDRTIRFTRADNENISFVNHSTALAQNTLTHVAVRKTGSELKVFINGNSGSNVGTDNTELCKNEADLFIGSQGGTRESINYDKDHDISQIMIFNRALTHQEIKNVSSSVDGTPFIGNIFYEQGVATLTSPTVNNSTLTSLQNLTANITLEATPFTQDEATEGPITSDVPTFSGSLLFFNEETLSSVALNSLNFLDDIEVDTSRVKAELDGSTLKLTSHHTGSLNSILIKPLVSSSLELNQTESQSTILHLISDTGSGNNTDSDNQSLTIFDPFSVIPGSFDTKVKLKDTKTVTQSIVINPPPFTLFDEDFRQSGPGGINPVNSAFELSDKTIFQTSSDSKGAEVEGDQSDSSLSRIAITGSNGTVGIFTTQDISNLLSTDRPKPCKFLENFNPTLSTNQTNLPGEGVAGVFELDDFNGHTLPFNQANMFSQFPTFGTSSLDFGTQNGILPRGVAVRPFGDPNLGTEQRGFSLMFDGSAHSDGGIVEGATSHGANQLTAAGDDRIQGIDFIDVKLQIRARFAFNNPSPGQNVSLTAFLKKRNSGFFQGSFNSFSNGTNRLAPGSGVQGVSFPTGPYIINSNNFQTYTFVWRVYAEEFQSGISAPFQTLGPSNTLELYPEIQIQNTQGGISVIELGGVSNDQGGGIGTWFGVINQSPKPGYKNQLKIESDPIAFNEGDIATVKFSGLCIDGTSPQLAQGLSQGFVNEEINVGSTSHEESFDDFDLRIFAKREINGSYDHDTFEDITNTIQNFLPELDDIGTPNSDNAIADSTPESLRIKDDTSGFPDARSIFKASETGNYKFFIQYFKTQGFFGTGPLQPLFTRGLEGFGIDSASIKIFPLTSSFSVDSAITISGSDTSDTLIKGGGNITYEDDDLTINADSLFNIQNLVQGFSSTGQLPAFFNTRDNGDDIVFTNAIGEEVNLFMTGAFSITGSMEVKAPIRATASFTAPSDGLYTIDSLKVNTTDTQTLFSNIEDDTKVLVRVFQTGAYVNGSGVLIDSNQPTINLTNSPIKLGYLAQGHEVQIDYQTVSASSTISTGTPDTINIVSGGIDKNHGFVIDDVVITKLTSSNILRKANGSPFVNSDFGFNDGDFDDINSGIKKIFIEISSSHVAQGPSSFPFSTGQFTASLIEFGGAIAPNAFPSATIGPTHFITSSMAVNDASHIANVFEKGPFIISGTFPVNQTTAPQEAGGSFPQLQFDNTKEYKFSYNINNTNENDSANQGLGFKISAINPNQGSQVTETLFEHFKDTSGVISNTNVIKRTSITPSTPNKLQLEFFVSGADGAVTASDIEYTQSISGLLLVEGKSGSFTSTDEPFAGFDGTAGNDFSPYLPFVSDRLIITSSHDTSPSEGPSFTVGNSEVQIMELMSGDKIRVNQPLFITQSSIVTGSSDSGSIIEGEFNFFPQNPISVNGAVDEMLGGTFTFDSLDTPTVQNNEYLITNIQPDPSNPGNSLLTLTNLDGGGDSIQTINESDFANTDNRNVTVDYFGIAPNDFVMQFKNNHLIFENEYHCTVDEHEYNFTLNPTARKLKSITDGELANFATGSKFKPYVTTVGLYNDEGELLVVGKLGQPVRMSDKTDTTFVVRYDT